MIQNQLVDVAAHQIRQKILDRVIADKVTDVSNKEQLSVVLRYVDPDTALVQEDLISSFECDEGITGSSLAKKITDSLESFGLDLRKLRGQSYDGVIWQAQLEAQQLLLVHVTPSPFISIASYALNLAVVKFLDVTSVRNVIRIVDGYQRFFLLIPKDNEL